MANGQQSTRNEYLLTLKVGSYSYYIRFDKAVIDGITVWLGFFFFLFCILVCFSLFSDLHITLRFAAVYFTYKPKENNFPSYQKLTFTLHSCTSLFSDPVLSQILRICYVA